MARKVASDCVTPRKLPRAKSAHIAELEQLSSTVLEEQSSKLSLHRMARSTVERIARLLRTSSDTEALEEAARLDTVASLMRPRADGRHFPRVSIRMEGAGWKQHMTRHEAAERLGVTVDSLSVMMSRGGGEASFRRMGDDGEPELVRVFRCNLTKSPKSLSPE